jgi:putative colanic acid biosynthesis acetyltransferase WcaF
MRLLKPPIHIADDVWICADAFVGPGVTIGEGAVVGARAVAAKDVPAWTVVVGNPAKEIRKRVLRHG